MDTSGDRGTAQLICLLRGPGSYSQNALMVLALAYYAFIVVGVAWFWLHCAEPELRYQRAGVRARRVVLGITLLSIGVNAFDAVITASRLAVPGLWWVTTITGALWILVVGLGYLQRYRFLIQATGSV